MIELGAVFISATQTDWEWQRSVFRRGKFTIAKIAIPKGFETNPQHVSDLIADGATTVILRTEDRITNEWRPELDAWEATKADLVDRGFMALIEQHPNVSWWLEVGNEPEMVGFEMADYRGYLLLVAKGLRADFSNLPIQLIASMPTRLDNTKTVLAHELIHNTYDALGTHIYGHHYLGDGGGGDWLAIHQHCLETGKPVWVTEAGVNDPMTRKSDKADRILHWLEQQPEQVIGATVFAIGRGSQWPQYDIDEPMADVFSRRTQTTPKPEPTPPEDIPDMLTIHSPFKHPPMISEAGFVSVLEVNGSFNANPLWEPTPRAERRKEAARIYSLIVSRGHDPAMFLGILGKEHSWGTNKDSVLWRGSTRSWTNARTVRDPSIKATLYHDSFRNSSYVKYNSVFDSVQDGLYRVDDPTFAYKAAHSIVDVIRIWAPSSDSNKPDAYAQTIVDWANRWVEDYPVEEESMTVQIPGFKWHPADDQHYSKGRSTKIRGGAQHYTAGTNSLAWLSTTPGTQVSANFLVKKNATLEDRGWQLVRMEDTAWTTAFANPYTVSIEYEHKSGQPISDGDITVLAQTWIDIAEYVKVKNLGEIKLDRTGIRGHKEWVNSPTLICPDGVDVDRIVNRIYELRSEKTESHHFHETGHLVGGGFWQFWQKFGGLALFGFPLTDEYVDPVSGLVVQYFERARFEWHPGKMPDHYDVVLGRLGSELLEKRAES